MLIKYGLQPKSGDCSIPSPYKTLSILLILPRSTTLRAQDKTMTIWGDALLWIKYNSWVFGYLHK
jgi:hypothetical protein